MDLFHFDRVDELKSGNIAFSHKGMIRCWFLKKTGLIYVLALKMELQLLQHTHMYPDF